MSPSSTWSRSSRSWSIDDLATAVPVARALVAGGLPVIELTLRTPVALDAIRAIADEVPEILVGAGTIVTPGQAKQALDAGAQFLVSPGTTPDAARRDGRHRAAVPARDGDGLGGAGRARGRASPR